MLMIHSLYLGEWYPLPNQELSVLYGVPTLNFGEQLSLYAARKYDRRFGTPAIV